MLTECYNCCREGINPVCTRKIEISNQEISSGNKNSEYKNKIKGDYSSNPIDWSSEKRSTFYDEYAGPINSKYGGGFC